MWRQALWRAFRSSFEERPFAPLRAAPAVGASEVPQRQGGASPQPTPFPGQPHPRLTQAGGHRPGPSGPTLRIIIAPRGPGQGYHRTSLRPGCPPCCLLPALLPSAGAGLVQSPFTHCTLHSGSDCYSQHLMRGQPTCERAEPRAYSLYGPSAEPWQGGHSLQRTACPLHSLLRGLAPSCGWGERGIHFCLGESSERLIKGQFPQFAVS